MSIIKFLQLNSDFVEFFRKLFDASDFMARWQCGRWTGFHGWVYIISDLLIFTAYFTIPILIYFYLRKKVDIKFKGIGVLFILFIFFCGSTHLLDAIIFWYPAYRLNGFLLICTAIVSWITVIGLVKVLPVAFSMKTTEELETIIDKRTFEITHQKQNLEDFSQIVSHNLRAPLASMASLLELHDLKSSQEEKDEQVEKIKQVLKRMNKSVNNVTEVMNWQLGEVKSEKVTIREIYEDVKNTLSAQIESEEVEIKYIGQKSLKITYPRMYIESIFLNLISNSIKYKNPDVQPQITISVKKLKNRNGDCSIYYSDNGLGIDLEKYKHKVFKLNQTFHGNKDARGIGLYLLKKHVEQIGGAIDIESEVGIGTTFKIVLKNQTE